MNPTESSGLPSRATVFLGLVVLLWVLGTLLGFYRVGSGEHDTFMMAASLVYGIQTGETINLLSYGANLQFLFYYLLKPVVAMADMDGQGVLRMMNVLGVVSSLVSPLLLFALLRKFLSGPQAAWACLLFALCPAWIMTTGYGHPFHLAFPLSIAAFLAYFRGLTATRGRLAWTLGGGVLMAASLCFRAEQIVLFCPVVLGLYWYVRRPSWRELAIFVGWLGGAAAVFLAARGALLPPTGTEEGGSPLDLLKYSLFRMETLVPSLAHHLVEVGVPLLGLGGLGGIILVRRRDWRGLAFLALVSLPSLLIYLNNPSPPRHLLSLGLALAVAWAVILPPPPLRRAVVLAAAVLVVNFALPGLFRLVLPPTDYDVPRSSTFNALERQWRNEEQIGAALPFMHQVFSESAPDLIVVGSWIHVAQAVMVAADQGDIQVSPVRTDGSGAFLQVERGDQRVVLVEHYDPGTAGELIAGLRAQFPGVAVVSLLHGGVNDLDLPLPAAIRWWTA